MRKISLIGIFIASAIIIICISTGVGAYEYYHNHSYTANTIEADCINNGYTIYTCACGDSYIEQNSVAFGHNYSKIIDEPRCKENGYSLYECNYCHKYYKEFYTEKEEHNFSDWEILIAPSIESNGIEVRTCVCGQKEVREYICEHINCSDIIIKDSTCLLTGKINSICTLCGKIVSEKEIPKKTHDFSEWEIISYPSPNNNGEKSRACNCGLTEKKSIPFKMAGENSIYIVSAGINANYIISTFTAEAVDSYDVVCNYTRIGDNNPAIFGHNTGSMKKLYNTEINTYIYFSVNGVIDTYIVRYSEKAIDTKDMTELLGLDTGYELFKDKDGETLRIFTCYEDKEYGDIRWIVMAEKVS